MSCANAPSELEAYADNELDLEHDAVVIAGIAEHLVSCGDCRAEVLSIRELSAALRRNLPRYPANDLLRARVSVLLKQSHANPETRSAPSTAALPPLGNSSSGARDAKTLASSRTVPRNWKLFALAASAMLAVVTTHDFLTQGPARPDAHSVDHDLIEAHIRSLQLDHLVDVPSSDRHTVKPWFEGKINFSPSVFDFAADSFPLAGGRLDYASGRETAAIVFHRGQHAINLFVWPTDSTDSVIREMSEAGYNIVSWRRNHLEYSAVSTLNQGSLAQFAAFYVARDSVIGAVQR